MKERYGYWVMDGRAADGTQKGFDRALAYTCCFTLREAQRDWQAWPTEYSIWQIDLVGNEPPVMVQAPQPKAQVSA